MQKNAPHKRTFPVFFQHTRGLAIARIRWLWANSWQLLALLRDNAHLASSRVRKSRKAGTWLAAMCWLLTFLLYTHTQNPGTCFRGTLVSGLNAATMVAKVSCNLTPRHPPSQVVDNLPRYGG
jgi:hypothetical protein